MKTGFVTDTFSTLGGLAAVAYYSPEAFRDVKNQIYSGSATKLFDTNRPGALLVDFIQYKDKFISEVEGVLQSEYDKDGDFTDFADIYLGSGWKQTLSRRFLTELERSVNSKSVYNTGLLQHATDALSAGGLNSSLASTVSQALLSGFTNGQISRDLSRVTKYADNNPQTKISTPPPNDVIQLEGSVDPGIDYRGVSFAQGYLSPPQYFENIAYPGFTSPFTLPPTLNDSISQGYVGYPPQVDITSAARPSSSVLSSELPGLEANDAVIYQISLMGSNLSRIINFDPAVTSNGDLMDPGFIPPFEENNFLDVDLGNPTLSRTYLPVF